MFVLVQVQALVLRDYVFQKILNDFYEKKIKENEKYYLKII
jgi:hypothetical protein